ncbi:YcaO-like family protein [Thalassomonas sp. RHCl1]|uniref:YcaO-like family protein n=1 Tax=Thalassomonas sp. RHCl1 TaxID=2995320 RepID=UPI00248B8A53|nr:YcaO-like family protein [Thalassomonas sp. RHCl1]
MQETVTWHPKFNVYVLENKDLLLVSESDSFMLSHIDFPGINLIDGINTLPDILSGLLLEPDKGAAFLQQIKVLKHQQILSTNQEVSCYINQTVARRGVIEKSGELYFINLSQETAENIAHLADMFTAVKIKRTSERRLCFVLVDSFCQLTTGLGDIEHYDLCFIKVTGEKILVSPLIPGASAGRFCRALQKRLTDNNPVLSLVKRLFPGDSRCIPFTVGRQYSTELQGIFTRLLSAQIHSPQQQLISLEVAGNQVQAHPLVLAGEGDEDFSRQILQPLLLQSCPLAFNRDGGSRTLAAEQTLQNITPFISPLTGVITHLRPVKGTESNAIKIYSAAFFKSPAAKDGLQLDNNRFVQICMGKGVGDVQSRVSALCETIERYSALYQGDEPLHLAAAQELDKPYYDFQQLAPYSQAQYQKFADPKHADAQLKQAARRYDGSKIHWLPSWSLTTKDQVYVPLASCFANIPFDDDRFGRWHSNGCAAGNNLEEAILQGLFELIERDATALWWYNRLERPAFDLNRLDSGHFDKLKSSLGGYDFWVLDLSHDIGVPVMAAVARDLKAGGLSFGFGCHLQPELAAQRALTELCQLIPIREQKGASFDFNAVREEAFLLPAQQAKTIKDSLISSGDLKTDILNIVAKLETLGFETLAVNYSRAPLPIKAVKVFVPGLCHIWPQLANERLYQAPLTLGWLDKANTESSINQQALYI